MFLSSLDTKCWSRSPSEFQLSKIARVVRDNMFMNFCLSAGYEWRNIPFRNSTFSSGGLCWAGNEKLTYSSTFKWFSPGFFYYRTEALSRKPLLTIRKLNEHFCFNYSIGGLFRPIPAPGFLRSENKNVCSNLMLRQAFERTWSASVLIELLDKRLEAPGTRKSFVFRESKWKAFVRLGWHSEIAVSFTIYSNSYGCCVNVKKDFAENLFLNSTNGKRVYCEWEILLKP